MKLGAGTLPFDKPSKGAPAEPRSPKQVTMYRATERGSKFGGVVSPRDKELGVVASPAKIYEGNKTELRKEQYRRLRDEDAEMLRQKKTKEAHALAALAQRIARSPDK